jgi:hypothetical protein
MPLIAIHVNTGQQCRAFSHQGNLTSDDGVTVMAQLAGEAEIEFEFWTRRDAVQFFRTLADAAEHAAPGDEDATYKSEWTTTTWEVFRAGER